METASQKRVLVVDDNATLRLLIAQTLEANGYLAIEADSGEAALEVALFNPPDVCVVDHLMPGMTGADLIRAMRGSADARLRSIPAIGLSGYTGSEQEMLDAGACDSLRKPCGEARLIDSIERALRLH
jgi:CheY-like chemotaxis protein